MGILVGWQLWRRRALTPEKVADARFGILA